MLLPYTSPFAKEYLATANNTLSNTSQYFDRAKGVDYAIQYAENYNPMYAYFWIGGDCTNFASQILLAGGVKMHDEMWPDTEQGWWYRGAGTNKADCSISWKNADRFVRYMGTNGNEYTSFYTFASKLMSGDHIALDFESDGNWNHMGFVTYIGSYNTYYYYDDDNVRHSKYYRDFAVAQHTSNYHAWTSSDNNNWEKADGSARYAIVRRGATA